MTVQNFLTLYLFTSVLGFGMAFLDEAGSSDLNAVRVRLEEEKAKRLLLENDVEVLMMKVARLERNRDQFSCNDIKKNETLVYFAARLSNQVTLASLETLIFDQVLFNEGGGYESASGIFRAPIGGLYLFSITALAAAKEYVHLEIIKSGQHIGRVFSGDSQTAWGDTAALTLVAKVDINEIVYVRELTGNIGKLYGNYWTSFSGVLLREV